MHCLKCGGKMQRLLDCPASAIAWYESCLQCHTRFKVVIDWYNRRLYITEHPVKKSKTR